MPSCVVCPKIYCTVVVVTLVMPCVVWSFVLWWKSAEWSVSIFSSKWLPVLEWMGTRSWSGVQGPPTYKQSCSAYIRRSLSGTLCPHTPALAARGRDTIKCFTPLFSYVVNGNSRTKPSLHTPALALSVLGNQHSLLLHPITLTPPDLWRGAALLKVSPHPSPKGYAFFAVDKSSGRPAIALESWTNSRG